MSRVAHLPILGITAFIFFLPVTAFLSLIDYYLDALTGELLPGKPLPALTGQLLYFQDHPLITEFATQPFSIAVTATYVFSGFFLLYSTSDVKVATRRSIYFQLISISIALLLTTAALTAILIPFVTGTGRLWLDDGPILADHEKLVRNSVVGYILILIAICIWRYRASFNRIGNKISGE